MANRYSQIVNTPYVPEFQAPNLSVLKSAADTLMRRDQQGMQAYDALYESMGNIDVLPSDQGMLEERVNQINSQLSEFTDSNDFIDAMPAIRRQAINLQKDLQQGDLSKAVLNKQNALETFEAIDDSNWTQRDKELMKQDYLENYEGAGSGQRLSVWTPPEYVDINEEIDKAIKDVEEQTQEFIGSIPIEGGGSLPAKVSRSGRGEAQIDAALAEKFQDPQFVGALRQEARLQGNRTDDEIIDYMSRRFESLSLQMRQKYGPVSDSFSNIQWDGMEMLSPTSGSRATHTPGITHNISTIPKGEFGSHLTDMRAAQIRGEEDTYQTLKKNLDLALIGAIEEEDSPLNHDDYNYFMENIEEYNANRYKATLSQQDPRTQYYGNPYQGTQQVERDPRMDSIVDAITEYIDTGDGVVGSSIMFNNPDSKTKEIIKDSFTNNNPANFEMISQQYFTDRGIEEEQDKLNEINRILKEGQLEGVEFAGDDSQPFYRVSVPVGSGDDRTYQTLFLREKSTPNIQDAGYTTPFEKIMNAALPNDPAGQQMIDLWNLHQIPTVGENIRDRIPADYAIPYEYLALTSQQGGSVTVDIGSEGDHKQLTKFDYLDSVNRNYSELIEVAPAEAEDSRLAVESMVNNSQSLLETEKKTILDNLTTGNIPQELIRKLKIELDVPYRFEDKVQAINFARYSRPNIEES